MLGQRGGDEEAHGDRVKRSASLARAIFLISSVMVLTFGSQSRNALSTTPAIHQGNLVISGNTVTVLEGRFDINGSIIIEQNATLLLRNAVLNFTQKGMNHNITLRNPAAGSPRLIAYNSTVTANGYDLRLHLLGNSSGRLEKCRMEKEVRIEPKGSSSLLVADSTFHFMSLSNFASCQLTGCSATKGMMADDHSSLEIRGCLIPYILCNRNSTVDVRESNINSYLLAKIYRGNCSVVRLRPGFVRFWNFLANCSVSLRPWGTAPKITVANTEVRGWALTIFSDSHVAVLESELYSVRTEGEVLEMAGSTISGPFSAYGGSQTRFSSCRLTSVDCNVNARVWIWNSTADLYSANQESNIYICQRLDVNVVDSTGPVSGANVTANFQDGTKADSALTDSSGIATLLLAQEIINATGRWAAGAYQVGAYHAGRSSSAAVDLNTTKQITLTLAGAPIGEVPLPRTALLEVSLAAGAALRMKARRRAKLNRKRAPFGRATAGCRAGRTFGEAEGKRPR